MSNLVSKGRVIIPNKASGSLCERRIIWYMIV